jgi:hypothetical protein
MSEETKQPGKSANEQPEDLNQEASETTVSSNFTTTKKEDITINTGGGSFISGGNLNLVSDKGSVIQFGANSQVVVNHTLTKNFVKPEEWELLNLLPLMVGSVVAVAGWSGLSGQIKENYMTAHAAWVEAQDDFPDSQLIQLIVRERRIYVKKAKTGEVVEEKPDWAEIEDREERYDYLRTRLRKSIPQALAIVQEKVEAKELQYFKLWLIGIGEKVAQAAKEGDLLGGGGENVSPEEQSILSEIAKLLGIEGYVPPNGETTNPV